MTSMDVDDVDDVDDGALRVYCEESSMGGTSPSKINVSDTNSIPDSIGYEAKAQAEEPVPDLPSLDMVCTCVFLFASS